MKLPKFVLGSFVKAALVAGAALWVNHSYPEQQQVTAGLLALAASILAGKQVARTYSAITDRRKGAKRRPTDT